MLVSAYQSNISLMLLSCLLTTPSLLLPPPVDHHPPHPRPMTFSVAFLPSPPSCHFCPTPCSFLSCPCSSLHRGHRGLICRVTQRKSKRIRAKRPRAEIKPLPAEVGRGGPGGPVEGQSELGGKRKGKFQNPLVLLLIPIGVNLFVHTVCKSLSGSFGLRCCMHLTPLISQPRRGCGCGLILAPLRMMD